MSYIQNANSLQENACEEFPPIHVLEEHFEYEPWSGRLVASKDCGPWRMGYEVGSFTSEGYRQIQFRRRTYPVHRLIWVIVYGSIPRGMFIDHVDGNPRNNSIYNLRLVTQGGNTRNQKLHRRNTSGVPGVSPTKAKNPRYRVRVGGVDYGSFPTFEEAAEKRKLLDTLFGFHPNHGRAREGVPS